MKIFESRRLFIDRRDRHYPAVRAVVTRRKKHYQSLRSGTDSPRNEGTRHIPLDLVLQNAERIAERHQAGRLSSSSLRTSVAFSSTIRMIAQTRRMISAVIA